HDYCDERNGFHVPFEVWARKRDWCGLAGRSSGGLDGVVRLQIEGKLALDVCRECINRVVSECLCRSGADIPKSNVFPLAGTDSGRAPICHCTSPPPCSICCTRDRRNKTLSPVARINGAGFGDLKT